MRSDLQIVADALRRYGFESIADDIEEAAETKDFERTQRDADAMNAISDNYGSGE